MFAQIQSHGRSRKSLSALLMLALANASSAQQPEGRSTRLPRASAHNGPQSVQDSMSAGAPVSPGPGSPRTATSISLFPTPLFVPSVTVSNIAEQDSLPPLFERSQFSVAQTSGYELVKVGVPVISAAPGSAVWRHSADAIDVSSETLPEPTAAPQVPADAIPPWPGAPERLQMSEPQSSLRDFLPGPGESIQQWQGPPSSRSVLPIPVEAAEPLFGEIVGDVLGRDAESSIVNMSPTFYRERVTRYRPPGVGRERVIHAPLEVDTTQPLNHISLGTDLAYDFLWPNRAEYFMAGPARGLGPEESLDYQDFLFKIELGTDKFSIATEIPIRGIDPEINRSHAGLGDMNLTMKTVFVDGRTWQITPMLRTHLNTGNVKLGLGTGNVALEPGVLFRYRVNDTNYIHASLKYWFPVGADPRHSGQVLSDGFAWSRVLRESDTYALISSLEAVHWQLMDGQRTTGTGVFDIDGENVFTAYAGARLVRDTGSDLGLVEYGLQWGTAFGDARWYQNLIRVSIRFSF